MNRSKTIFSVLLAVSICLIGYLGKTIEPDYSAQSILTYSDLKDAGGSPTSALLGELRANLSYILMMKTEQYMHGGVRYRPLTEREIALGRAEIHHEGSALPSEDAHEHEHQHDTDIVHEHEHEHDAEHEHEHGEAGHSHGAQFVPPEWDKRGIFGDIERAVHPYEKKGQGKAGDTVEMLPWFRLVTLLNPRFAKAYVIGGFVIAAHGEKVDEAVIFLREGEKRNPKSMEIKESLGRMFLYRKDSPVDAKPLFAEAISIGKTKTELSRDEEHALRGAYSNLTLLEWKSNNDPISALRVIADGLERFPEDMALVRLKDQISSQP